MRVSKEGHDWLARCSEHDESVWCFDWMGAMEAAWGHVVMHHSRNLDTQHREVHAA